MSDIKINIVEEDLLINLGSAGTYNVNGAETLNDLTDVNINPALNDVLRYDGSEWIESDLSDKAAAVHNHVINDVTNLQTSLDGKASSVHAHSESDITNLVGHLAAKSDVGHTHTIANVSNLQSTLDGKAAVSHNHTISQVTSLQTSLDAKQNTITGAASTIVSANLTPSTVVVTDAFGKITTSPTISSTELSYLNNVTSNVQTQINAKASTTHTHDDRYFTESETTTLLGAKQDALVSGTNIKTVNNTSLLGAGNIEITAGAGAFSDLTDVNLTDLAIGDVPVWDGTDWVNQPNPEPVLINVTCSTTLNTWNDIFTFTLADGENTSFWGDIVIKATSSTNINNYSARFSISARNNAGATQLYSSGFVGIGAIGNYYTSGNLLVDVNFRIVYSGSTGTLQYQTKNQGSDTFTSLVLSYSLFSPTTEVTGGGGSSTWGAITGTLSDQTDLNTALGTKVDKVTGKGLSTEDYTTTEKSKLAGIAAGAEVNVNADWNSVTGDSQILNKPTIPTLPISISDVTSLQTSLDGKQASLGFTAENQANKENTTIDTSTTKYPTVNLLKTGLDSKANTSHTHDDRYYTETEIDTMIGDIETLLAAL